jgi:hypothetical protein
LLEFYNSFIYDLYTQERNEELYLRQKKMYSYSGRPSTTSMQTDYTGFAIRTLLYYTRVNLIQPLVHSTHREMLDCASPSNRVLFNPRLHSANLTSRILHLRFAQEPLFTIIFLFYHVRPISICVNYLVCLRRCCVVKTAGDWTNWSESVLPLMLAF